MSARADQLIAQTRATLDKSQNVFYRLMMKQAERGARLEYIERDAAELEHTSVQFVRRVLPWYKRLWYSLKCCCAPPRWWYTRNDAPIELTRFISASQSPLDVARTEESLV